jgi:hypothetical protein
LDGLSFHSIGVDESAWFERAFEDKEALEVVKDLNGDKVLSNDGFCMAFFWKCWEVMKEDTMDVFKEFHS